MAADKFQEVFQLVFESLGEDKAAALEKILREVGDAGGAADEKLTTLVDELRKIGEQKAAVKTFTDLVTAQKELAAASETAGLKLKLATEAEQSADVALKKRTASLAVAIRLEGKNSAIAKLMRQDQKAAAAEYAAASKTLKESVSSYDKVATAQEKVTKQLTPLEKGLKQAGVGTDNLAKTQKNLADQSTFVSEKIQASAKYFKDAADAQALLDKKSAELSASLKKVAAEAGRSGGFTKVLSKGAAAAGAGFSKLRGGVNSLGSSLLRITGIAGILGTAFAAFKSLRVFGSAVDSAVEFEAKLVKIGALAGASTEQMKLLKAAANDAGAAYGISASDTADALEELVRASGSAAAAIAQLPATLALAKTGGIGLGDAATYVVQTLSQFNLEADKASHVADVLAHEANLTLDSIEGVGDALSYAAPLAFQFGASLEDTTSAIGALAQSGFRGSRAGTALARTFTQLIDPSSAFNAELKKLGIESTDFATVINELAKRGDGARDALLSLGQRAGPAITALVNNGNAEFNDLRKSMQHVQGEAQRTAEAFTENFAGAKGKLASALDKLRRSVVDKALGPISEGFTKAAIKIRAFIDTAQFTELTAAVKDFSTKAVKAVSDFVGSIDFARATKRITGFISGAGGAVSKWATDLSGTASTVTTALGYIGIAFTSLKGVVFSAAAAVTGFVTVGLIAIQKLAVGAALATGNMDAAREASHLFEGQIGGLTAVADEFARRGAKAFDDVSAAANKTTNTTKKLIASIDDITAATLPFVESIHVMTDAQVKAAAAQKALAASQKQAMADSDALKQAYITLGVTSQASLDKTASLNKLALAKINHAFRNNKATIDDVTAATIAYETAAAAAARTPLPTPPAPGSPNDVNTYIRDATKNTKDLGQEIAKVDITAAHASDSTAGVAYQISQSMVDARAQFDGASKSARDFFDAIVVGSQNSNDALQEFGAADSGAGILNFYAGLIKATRETTAAIDAQKAGVERLQKRFTDFAATGIGAVDSLGRKVGELSEARLDLLVQQIKDGRTQFNLLGKENLAGLLSAAQAAINKVNSLKDAAKAADDQIKDIGASLQDEIDQAEGNNTAVENRRYAAQLEQLKALAKASGDINSREFNEAMARANELHQLKLKQINDEAAAQQRAQEQAKAQADTASKASPSASQSAQGSDSTLTVKIDQATVGKINPNDAAGIAALARALLPEIMRQLKLAAQRSGRGG